MRVAIQERLLFEYGRVIEGVRSVAAQLDSDGNIVGPSHGMRQDRARRGELYSEIDSWLTRGTDAIWRDAREWVMGLERGCEVEDAEKVEHVVMHTAAMLELLYVSAGLVNERGQTFNTSLNYDTSDSEQVKFTYTIMDEQVVPTAAGEPEVISMTQFHTVYTTRVHESMYKMVRTIMFESLGLGVTLCTDELVVTREDLRYAIYCDRRYQDSHATVLQRVLSRMNVNRAHVKLLSRTVCLMQERFARLYLSSVGEHDLLAVSLLPPCAAVMYPSQYAFNAATEFHVDMSLAQFIDWANMPSINDECETSPRTSEQRLWYMKTYSLREKTIVVRAIQQWVRTHELGSGVYDWVCDPCSESSVAPSSEGDTSYNTVSVGDMAYEWRDIALNHLITAQWFRISRDRVPEGEREHVKAAKSWGIALQASRCTSFRMLCMQVSMKITDALLSTVLNHSNISMTMCDAGHKALMGLTDDEFDETSPALYRYEDGEDVEATAGQWKWFRDAQVREFNYSSQLRADYTLYRLLGAGYLMLLGCGSPEVSALAARSPLQLSYKLHGAMAQVFGVPDLDGLSQRMWRPPHASPSSALSGGVILYSPFSSDRAFNANMVMSDAPRAFRWTDLNDYNGTAYALGWRYMASDAHGSITVGALQEPQLEDGALTRELPPMLALILEFLGAFTPMAQVPMLTHPYKLIKMAECHVTRPTLTYESNEHDEDSVGHYGMSNVESRTYIITHYRFTGVVRISCERELASEYSRVDRIMRRMCDNAVPSGARVHGHRQGMRGMNIPSDDLMEASCASLLRTRKHFSTTGTLGPCDREPIRASKEFSMYTSPYMASPSRGRDGRPSGWWEGRSQSRYSVEEVEITDLTRYDAGHLTVDLGFAEADGYRHADATVF